jgi:uncharacterized membrane protein
MVKEFVNPNWHVVLVHYPIGLLFAGVLIELFSFLGWRRGGFRAAGRWMILLGALSSLPTALSGAYALSDAARMGLDQTTASGEWKQVAQVSPLVQDREAWKYMTDHAWLQSISTGILLFVVVIWIGCSDNWRAKLHLPLLILLLVGAGFVAAGAWKAGEGVYLRGVAVTSYVESEAAHRALNNLLESATTSAATAPATREADSPAGDEQRDAKAGIEYYLPPLQVHVIVAGFAVALSMVGLGLAMRAATQPAPPVGGDDIAAALGKSADDDDDDDDEAFLTTEQRLALRSAAQRGSLPPARFWMLAFLLTLVTALVGYWVLARDSSNWKPQDLWQLINFRDAAAEQNPFGLTRRLAHVLGGGSIAVLTLVLAMLGRWAPRARVFLALFAVLLLAVIAAQVWLGVLMLYDTPSGPIQRFN